MSEPAPAPPSTSCSSSSHAMLLYTSNRDEGLRVHVSVPAVDEVCAMTMETMAEYELDFAPGQTIVQDKPLVRKMLLPCGHAFSAMACLYQFSLKGLRCPLCRHGFELPLSDECVPAHLRKMLVRRVLQRRQEDMQEEESENLQQSLSYVADTIVDDFEAFTDNNHVVMAVYCYGEVSEVVPVVSFDYTLRGVMLNENELEFMLPMHMVRLFSRQMNFVHPMTHMEFAVGLRTDFRDFVYLDKSPKIDMCALRDGCAFEGQNASRFDVQACMDDGNLSFLGIRWCTTYQAFLRAMNRPLAIVVATM